MIQTIEATMHFLVRNLRNFAIKIIVLYSCNPIDH